MLPAVNLPILLPVTAGCITVFTLVLIGACVLCVEPRPIKRRRIG